ncbi:DUF2946 family protein [Dyella silvae]|uniref:DUF2946 family protein n=1 Tax=Dyella silvae TaxID=2994424 RepID=UPI003CE4B2B5
MMALWLTIVAPVISQTITMDAESSMVMGCGPHRDHSLPSSPHSGSMEKCGYCGLLSHSPVMPGSGLSLPMCSPSADCPHLLHVHSGTEPFVLAAAPRGPPVTSQR